MNIVCHDVMSVIKVIRRQYGCEFLAPLQLSQYGLDPLELDTSKMHYEVN